MIIQFEFTSVRYRTAGTNLYTESKQTKSPSKLKPVYTNQVYQKATNNTAYTLKLINQQKLM